MLHLCIIQLESCQIIFFFSTLLNFFCCYFLCKFLIFYDGLLDILQFYNPSRLPNKIIRVYLYQLHITIYSYNYEQRKQWAEQCEFNTTINYIKYSNGKSLLFRFLLLYSNYQIAYYIFFCFQKRYSDCDTRAQPIIMSRKKPNLTFLVVSADLVADFYFSTLI